MLLAGFSRAQSFSSPESVDFDAVRGRWIVAQNGSGEIHVYQPQTNTLSVLATGIASGPHGIECVGDTVFCCDGSRIRGYNLVTGTQVFNLNLGATFLNGLTYDGNGRLYATDFSGKKIYRVQIATATGTAIANTAYQPNGIYFDGSQNRCVFVNWGTNARIQAIDLTTNAITDLYVSTFSNIDGITRDAAGRWYITTWGGNALRRFDPDFSAAPVSVLTGLSNPADIATNAAGDSIGIPNSGSANNVVFYAVPQVVSVSCIADDSTVCAGQSVTYTAQASGNVNSWSWTFPGGTPSTASTPTAVVTYFSFGVYDVTLIAANTSGSSDTVNMNSWITVSALPAQPVITQSGSSLQVNDPVNEVQWLYNQQEIPGATATSYTPSQSGGYQVQVTNAAGCITTSAGYDFVLTPIGHDDIGYSLSVGPVPSRDQVFITSNQGLPFSVCIIDMQGRKWVQEGDISSTFRLMRQDMPAGVYTAIVTVGEEKYFLRFIWQ